jgi:type IV secretion/conjugal transfer VirB4 family ATPase
LIKISRILKDYAETGALNALVNVHAAVDDHTFLTKAGGLVAFLRLSGADAECMEPLEMDQLARRFGSAVRLFDERFRIYQYLIKGEYGPIPASPLGDVEAARATRERIATLETHGLYRIEVRFAIVYEEWRSPVARLGRLQRWIHEPAAAFREMLSSLRTIDLLETDLIRARQELHNRLRNFIAQLNDFLHVEILDKRAAFHFLRGLLNYTPYKNEGVDLVYDSYVDFQACGSVLECHRDHLRLDDECVQMLTLKDPPSLTYAHLFKGLQELPGRFIAVTEWKRAGHRQVRRLIQSKRRHHHNSKASLLNYIGPSQGSSKDMLIDDSAAAMVSELGASLEEIEVKGAFLGEFSLSVILHDRDRESLRHAVSECYKVFSSVGAQATEEQYNLLNAFLAVLPGNHHFNLRRLWITDTSYADLSFLFVPHLGEIRNAHLGTEYLSLFETNQRTPYFFNLHYGDVAHMLMLGATGSGKSYSVSFLLTHLQKFHPFTYVFDLGSSYRDVTQRFGGAYVQFGSQDAAPTINPFSLPLSSENLQFLCSLVRVLAESGGAAVTAADERDIFEQIQNLYEVEPQQRRLMTLANILSRPLSEALRRWVHGGQYGTVFDNVQDTLTFARFQTFDFEGMDQAPPLLEPLLFYVLHRAQATITDEGAAATFKVFVIDEAWRFLRNPVIRNYVREAVKTWRKKNAGVILATQSGDDLFHSELFPVIAESCPTQFFLSNPGMDAAAYREAFHLTEVEAQTIATLIPKRQFLLKRPNLSKVLNLDLERSRTS